MTDSDSKPHKSTDSSSSVTSEDVALQRAFFYLEIATILLTMFSQAGWVSYAIHYHWLAPVAFAAMTVAMALSFIRPKSTKWRFLHILLQCFVISIACSLGL